MRSISVSLVFLLALPFLASAQAVPDWNWTRDIQCSGSTSPSNGFGLAIGDSGNVFLAGYFQSSITVGGTTYNAAAGNDALLVKYSPQGIVLWSDVGNGTGMENATCVTVDNSGNTYLAGIFTSNLDFGGITANNPTTGFSQIFLIKYDRFGNILWLRTAGGAGNDNVEDITTDAAGNIYLAGSFQQTAIFGSLTVVSAGGSDAFVAKYDASGNALWIRSGSGSALDAGYGLACDNSGGVHLVGYFSNTADFSGQQLTSAGNYDVFWAQYDAAGALVRLHRAGGVEADYGYGITVHPTGDMHITGAFGNTVVFGNDTLTSAGFSDAFLMRCDPAGDPVTAVRWGGAGSDYGYDIERTSNFGAAVSGYFDGTMTLGANYLISAGSRDAFMAGFDFSCNNLWAVRTGGTGFDQSYAVTCDTNDRYYFTGSYYGQSVFGNDTLNGGARTSLFLSQLRSCDAISVSAPQGYCAANGVVPLNFSVSSNNSSYTYTWNPGALTGSSISVTPSSTTDYIVTADDGAGCLLTAITTAIVESPAGFSIASSTDTVCTGSTVDLFASWEWVNPSPAPTSYCTITNGNSQADEQITSVSFAMMSNPQQDTCGSNYTDYTSSVAPIRVNRGSAYPFSVTTDECDGPTYYSSGLCIYIDFNRDGDWNDTDERAYTTSMTTLSPNTRSGSITIPASASVGLTRMRVVVLESQTTPPACGTITYGEAEDYLLDIETASIANSWSNSTSDSSWIRVLPSATTTYSVSSTSEFGCTASAWTTITLVPTPNPVITAPSAACVPSAFTLDAGPGYTSYDWYTSGIPSGNGQTISDSMLYSPVTRQYVVRVTSSNGCSATDTVSVTATDRPDPVSICIVTVDSSSQYNHIIWEKNPASDAVDSFLVYREITTNNYLQVGAVHRSALSVFTDTNVNVNSTNYRYKIAWRDTCGNTDALSLFHSTIHLQYLGLGNLQWTSYEVENNPNGIVAGYEIFRDDASTGNFQLLQAVSGTSRTFTDINYNSYPNARYVVDIIPVTTLNCSPTRSFSTSRSNIRSISVSTGITGVIKDEIIRVFPNPADESITISLAKGLKDGPVSLDILDAVGRKIRTIEFENHSQVVPIAELSPGIYGVRLKNLQGGYEGTSTFIKR